METDTVSGTEDQQIRRDILQIYMFKNINNICWKGGDFYTIPLSFRKCVLYIDIGQFYRIFFRVTCGDYEQCLN